MNVWQISAWQKITLLIAGITTGGALIVARTLQDNLVEVEPTQAQPSQSITLSPTITATFRLIPPWPTQTPPTPAARAVTRTPRGMICRCDQNLYNCRDFADAAEAQGVVELPE